MTIEEYQDFIKLQDQYFEKLEKVRAWFSPIVKKIQRSKSYPGQRHSGSFFDSDTSFGAEEVGYGISCCGDTNWNSERIQDLFSNNWHRKLQEKINTVDGLFKEAHEKARTEEKAKLEARLKELGQ